MKTPTISIIIPIYNTEKYLKKCIESILNQTFEEFELLLINDGSTDGCGKICDEFALQDDRIKVFHKQNGGESSARNDGLKKANGKWVGFVDSDDICEKNMFEVLYENALNHGADISVCGINSTFIDNLPYKKNDDFTVKKLNQNQAIKSIFTNIEFASSVCNKIYKKDTILKNNIFFYEDIIDGEDLFFLYYIIKHSFSVIFTQQKLYHYIQHEASYTASGKIEDKMTGIKTFIKIIEEEVDGENAKIMENYFLKYLIRIGCYNVRHKEFNKKYHRYLIKLLKSYKYKILFKFKLGVKNKLIALLLFFPNIFLFILNTKKQMRKFLK